LILGNSDELKIKNTSDFVALQNQNISIMKFEYFLVSVLWR